MPQSLNCQQMPDTKSTHGLQELCQKVPDKMKSQRDKYAESFADYMIEAMSRTGLRQTDIAKNTGLSRQTISQLVGKRPHQLTGKLLLPERETVDKIAIAFGDSVASARAAAGYFVEKTDTDHPDESIEDALSRAQYFHAKGLSQRDLDIIRPILEALDRQVEELTKD